jgi:hypothetical protein
VWVWCVQLLSYVQEQHYQHMQEWNRSFANALATTVGDLTHTFFTRPWCSSGDAMQRPT